MNPAGPPGAAPGPAGPRPAPLPLAQRPTPVETLDRLTDWLGGPRLLIKRDDQTGLALGGNKARKLDHLCAEALALGCDTLVTGGGPQSNHCRMTAAAANRLGLECHLALAGPAPAAPSGNLLLDHLLGAHLHATGAREYYEIEASIEAVAGEVRRAGRRPYAIPVGGASVTGALGYVVAARELTGQVDRPVDWIVVADGSGGTHAGLLAGLDPDGPAVLGVDVGTRPDLDQRVPELAAATAAAAGRPVPAGEVHIDHTRFGAGYGQPTPECLEALRAVARLEGVILDPVYTGKAMAGLIGYAREGRFTDRHTVLFWHTGGAPALFAGSYTDWLTS
ncbi:MAG TPA: D-cysteine desulfhydrase family protein [Acidimicrobiia bacterium]|nr:D-cysteine desulfhydrase family protein [Acidimicrobiia bacterium]